MDSASHKTISDVLDSSLSFQPSHSYLLLLKYDPASNWFFDLKRWDVTTGLLVPDTEGEVQRAANGKSILNGLTLDKAVATLAAHHWN